MATNCHKFPNIMLPKSLDGDSAPIRFQTDVPLTVKALLISVVSPCLVILRKLLYSLRETKPTHAHYPLSVVVAIRDLDTKDPCCVLIFEFNSDVYCQILNE